MCRKGSSPAHVFIQKEKHGTKTITSSIAATENLTPCSGASAPGSAKYKGLHSWLLPGSAQASYSSDEMKEGGFIVAGLPSFYMYNHQWCFTAPSCHFLEPTQQKYQSPD